MPVLDELKARFASAASLMDQSAVLTAKYTADISALRDQLNTLALNTEDFIMLNAAALVAEATAKLQADIANAADLQKQVDTEKATEADLQKQLDAAKAEIAALQPGVVTQEQLAPLDAVLHPAPPAPVVPA